MKIANMLAVAFVAPIITAGAQQVAPAAVVRPTPVYVDARQAPIDSIRPLSVHVKRGAIYGALTGVVLSGLVIVALKANEPRCCDGPETWLTFRQGLGLLTIGTAGGSAIGTFLGFTYHFQLLEKQRQRTIAHP